MVPGFRASRGPVELIRMKEPWSPQFRSRVSLPVEVADCLRERLLGGEWGRVLPGEFELARALQVGRNTIRAALSILEKEGLVRTVPGRRREVVERVGSERQLVGKVAVLVLRTPWQTLAQAVLLWMEALRSRLQSAGWQLHFVVEPAAFRRVPGAALEVLVERHPSAVWILYRSTAPMQRWFEKRQLPTVIAGSCHGGISLPQVDTDFRATSRHAAARLLGLGHRSVAVLVPAISFPGNEESLRVLRESFEGAILQVFLLEENKASVLQALKTLLSAEEPPTAIFVFEARHAATALTGLAQHGVPVPARMSLLSRDDEPFLSHLVPEPARYERKPDAFAKKLAHLVTSLGNGLPLKQVRHLLMPTFVKGETLGLIPVLKKNS
jgi:DNA-binding LacI/PurR family transcriptional regulator